MTGRPLLLRALAGETLERPPIWLMRQAGRALPEYRALRASVDGFLGLCLDPDHAAEVTLQPMRRFPLDAAVVFADILLLPMVLGQSLAFETGEGPRLGPLPPLEELREAATGAPARLESVAATLRLVRERLEPERALIGFAGGPWTVATYMLEGRGGDAARASARARIYSEAPLVEGLVDLLADVTSAYLMMQVRAGAQVLQIFESWCELLPEDVFDRLVIKPHARILRTLRAQGVDAPVIGFPRGAGALVESYAARTGVQAVSLDVQAPAELGRRLQAQGLTIQGALDPLLLKAGGPAMSRRTAQMLTDWSGGPYIFNLGHGVMPDTPLEHIETLVSQVTGWRGA